MNIKTTTTQKPFHFNSHDNQSAGGLRVRGRVSYYSFLGFECLDLRVLWALRDFKFILIYTDNDNVTHISHPSV